jgi:hypothetical protein
MPVLDDSLSVESEDDLAILKSPINSNIYPGARFTGYQKSKSTQYSVEVQIDYIDWNQSYICGCLNIRGLTAELASIETFFTGEIIGQKFPFLTRKWDADYSKDLKHWR